PQAHEAGLIWPRLTFLVLAGGLIQERLLLLIRVAAGVIDVMARVNPAVVEFDFRVYVIAAARRIKATLVQPIAGLLILIEIDSDDGVIPAGRLAFVTDLRSADHAPCFEIDV